MFHHTLHEPGGQLVYCGEDEAASGLLSSHKTMSTEFVAYNTAATAVDDAEDHTVVALTFLCQDFPTHFPWDKVAKKWKPRGRRVAQPQVGVFALRTLAIVRHSTSACLSPTCQGSSPSGLCAHPRTVPLQTHSWKHADREVVWRTTWGGTAA